MQYIGLMDNNTHIQKLKRSTLRDQIYDSLKSGIVTLQFSPGQKLSDAELAVQFGVSRTPVREALKRLEDEGLIQSFPGSITRVAPLNETQAAQALVVVASLHVLTVRSSVLSLTNEHISRLEETNLRLQQALETQNLEQVIQEDDAFHAIFVKVAANPEIEAVLERITPKLRRLELAKLGSQSELNSVSEHKDIIAACREGNTDAASALTELNWLSLGRIFSV
ncbi:GntR family transcriptional regulator [Paenibacillus antarcticus]|uniref:GntR family transcriptional regulator n=2 Tax=Paenibacillus antarcticus TaxID=253703 RepID=A0A162LXF2_9BACL|nr:GntR family transcriptional regulator [Paenibacillus antarcticus]OAB41287.1 GntR family transcriptional regulator [Paenibacillus antarcticus]